MTGYNASFVEQESRSFNSLSGLVVSLDLRGLKGDVSLARLEDGETPKVLLGSESIVEVGKKLGLPVNDMRSTGASLEEWSPTPADMMRRAQAAMAEVAGMQDNHRATTGPKMG